jgi:hypothetical protein
MCFRLSVVSFSSFAQLCTCVLDLEVFPLREILLREAGPAELLVVLADVEGLENRRSIRTGERDRNLPVPLHALAVLLVDRRAENRAVAQEKAAPRSSLLAPRALARQGAGSVRGLVALVLN